MNFLYLIIEELLPFVRGRDLLALALTSRSLHERIFKSKRWKALPFVKDLNDIHYTWNYGLLKVTIEFNAYRKLEEYDCLKKYIDTGLPIEISFFRNGPVEPTSLTDSLFHCITKFNWIYGIELESIIEHGLIPEKMRDVSLLDLNVPYHILSRMTRLQSLRLREVTISSSISHFNVLPNLKKLEIKSEYLDCSYLELLNNVTILRINAKTINNLFKLKEWKNLKELSILARIEDISFLEFLDELKFLTLKCELLIAKFPSSPPKKLKRLQLNNYRYGNLDWLSEWTSLEIIRIQYMRFLDINSLQTCANLKKVDLAMATINSLRPLAKCLNLMELRFYRCVENDWESLAGLKNLQCIETNFDGETIPESFSKLSISRLKIKNSGTYSKFDVTLSPTFMRQLTQLNLSYVTPNSLSFLEYATRLTLLQINNDRIQDIEPLSQLVQLEELYLEQNKIENISPLSGLLKLRSLNLWNNCIVDIEPLSNLLELENLDLSYNDIRDVKPLFGLKKLFILNLSFNNVPESDLKKLMCWKRRNSNE